MMSKWSTIESISEGYREKKSHNHSHKWLWTTELMPIGEREMQNPCRFQRLPSITHEIYVEIQIFSISFRTQGRIPTISWENEKNRAIELIRMPSINSLMSCIYFIKTYSEQIARSSIWMSVWQAIWFIDRRLPGPKDFAKWSSDKAARKVRRISGLSQGSSMKNSGHSLQISF
jgi:hypothetical protein